MAVQGLCSVPNCGKVEYARLWCKKHYDRNRKHGDPLKSLSTPPGEAQRYYREVVQSYDGDECLIWPFNKPYRPRLRRDGKNFYVSRILCEEVNGPPPTPEHEAAHSCGKGHEGCVAKRHLSWKTQTENQADRVIHGTAQRGERTGMAKLSPDDVMAIMAMKGKHPTNKIAKQFRIACSTVNNIHGRHRWAWLTSSLHI